MDESAGDVEFDDEQDTPLEVASVDRFSQAVLYSTDWTVETIVSQLTRGNIDLNPRFQRRDAWSPRNKSRFIESAVLGLPIPQIVLAEKPGERGKFVVLDGKQRLLTLLQYTGNSTGPRNEFGLSGLEARTDLTRKKYSHLNAQPDLVSDLNAFLNHTIRTVVIRNWPDTDFLHLVFRRLNTGSVKLSSHELRQAVVAGPFLDYVDDQTQDMPSLWALLGKREPDARMRDVELLVRALAFQLYLPEYGGRMKDFLDLVCGRMNDDWDASFPRAQALVSKFRDGLTVLVQIFGESGIARKPGSNSFNRAIFDALIFYCFSDPVRQAMAARPQAVRDAYHGIWERDQFAEAVESDTAGIPNTASRMGLWGAQLAHALGIHIPVPTENRDGDRSRLEYRGVE
ncbi:DUF262 domain-containing protein [Maricaulis sp.]|uniref:DUF262 domain-containing protein n=1 Tax=Maricaulis sp. TaxID=1486257 RepID=UPI003A90C478